MKNWLLALTLVVSSCASARDLARLDQMTGPELARYKARVEVQVQTVAAALIAEGDLTSGTAELIAVTLDGLAAGTTAPGAGGIVAALDLRGYTALAVQLAVVELDASLEERGAYEEGGWPLAAEVLGAVSKGIRGAAVQGAGP